MYRVYIQNEIVTLSDLWAHSLHTHMHTPYIFSILISINIPIMDSIPCSYEYIRFIIIPISFFHFSEFLPSNRFTSSTFMLIAERHHRCERKKTPNFSVYITLDVSRERNGERKRIIFHISICCYSNRMPLICKQFRFSNSLLSRTV